MNLTEDIVEETKDFASDPLGTLQHIAEDPVAVIAENPELSLSLGVDPLTTSAAVIDKAIEASEDFDEEQKKEFRRMRREAEEQKAGEERARLEGTKQKRLGRTRRALRDNKGLIGQDFGLLNTQGGAGPKTLINGT
jgi:hypothetical protein